MKTFERCAQRKTACTMWAAAAVLAACGGGGGGAAGDNNPLPAGTSLALTGTAVKGAALAGASVSAKCASGSATATTAASGAYSVTLNNAILPCVVRVTDGAGGVFHSVVPGSGSSGSYTANVTPLTEMLVARLAGASPAAFFAGFGASSSISAAQVTQASDYVRSAVAGVADLSGVDLVAGALAVGDATDQKIDAVMAAINAAGTSLESVAAAIVANPGSPAVVAAAVAPTASGCAALRSGRYRVVGLFGINAERFAALDATTLVTTPPDGNATTLTDDGNCRYTADEPDWLTRLAVAPTGVIVVQGGSKTTAERSAEIAIPEQTLPLAELAGTWNAASWAPSGTGVSAPTVHEITIGATGQVLALADCSGLSPCVPQSGPFSSFAADAAKGGFTETLPGGQVWTRLFVYKTLVGRKVFVAMTPERQFIIGTPKLAIGTLPAVGTVGPFYQLQLNGNDVIDTMSDDTVTVTAVDTAARTVTRIRASDSRVDTLSYDKPRDGLRHRALNSCTLNGAPRNCTETVQIALQGFGMVVSTSVGTAGAAAFMNISVNKPVP